jgi:hypothetical protein
VIYPGLPSLLEKSWNLDLQVSPISQEGMAWPESLLGLQAGEGGSCEGGKAE